METVMTDDKKVKKVGMKDIQREGWEYELTVSLNIDRDTHKAIASKDRTELFDNKEPFLITEKTGELIRDWCERGVDTEQELQDAVAKLANCNSVDELTMLKDTLSESIVKHPKFIAAAKERFNQVKAA
jgi:hypothetical protein